MRLSKIAFSIGFTTCNGSYDISPCNDKFTKRTTI